MKKSLIITADDFGLHDDINRGIEVAIKNGVVNSVSFVTNTPLFEDSLKIIKRYPDVSVGVHLNITDEPPLSSLERVKFLLNNKQSFLGNHFKVIYSVISNPRQVNQIKLEFELQIKRLLDNNITISHLNSHGHIHIIPCLFKITLELSKKFNIPFIRIPEERLFKKDYFYRWDIVGINLLSKYVTHKFRNSQFNHTDSFFGLRYAGRLTRERLTRIIRNLDYGTTEIVTHPGYENYSLSQRFNWNYSWREELLALMANEIKEEARYRKIEFINFQQIL
ncbi:MAG: ChbG/HpnK family deacetylase [Candidatus Omnitrophota bacterium]|nr:ChbG/HpnK family deacetylase [Candidatus Omnitrophota bacterium]